MPLRIVLVEPREAGNVGAVARVMKNFGFDDLWIVGDHPQLLPVAGWWASGADDLLEGAHLAETLQEALADRDVIHVATHAAMFTDTPEWSGIQLRDGRMLTLGAIERLTLKPGCLVFLTACESSRVAIRSRSDIFG